MADFVKLIDSGRPMRQGFAITHVPQAEASGYIYHEPEPSNTGYYSSVADLNTLYGDRFNRPRYYTDTPSGLPY